MNNTYIVYESKYGCTQDIAKNLAMILGPAKYCTTGQWNKEYETSDFIVIGSPIYYEQVDQKIYDFVKKNIDWLQHRKVSLFCVSLMSQGAEKYLEPLKDILGECVVSMKALGGRLELSKLDAQDFWSMQNFSRTYGFSFKDKDQYDIKQIIDYGLSIKKERDCYVEIPKKELKTYVEQFLLEHNTCTLCSGYNRLVRGTPIEYTYKEGYLYLLSEGGTKFANLLLNEQVSIAVYEVYTGMNNLAGMQITGSAQIIEDDSKDYRLFMVEKGIEENQLPSPLHLIKIKIEKVEFLWFEFKKMGYGIKQYFQF